MRDPTIHITLSNLKTVLSYYFDDVDDYVMSKILSSSRKYQIRDRYAVQVKNLQQLKRVQKVVDTSVDDIAIDKFNMVLYTKRKELDHKFTMKIGRKEAAYTNLVKAAELCMAFHVASGASDYMESCITYITIGLKLMGKRYALNKFSYYNERIVETAKAKELIKQEKESGSIDNAISVYEYYCNLISESTGVDWSDRNITEVNFVSFIYAYQDADEAGADYSDWVSAQFSELAWTGSVPEYNQLFGENAIHRYSKWAAAVGKKTKDKTTLNKNSSDKEKQYWDNIKN